MKRDILRILTAFLLCACFFVNIITVSAQQSNVGKSYSASEATGSDKTGSDYDTYLSLYSDKEYADTDIVRDFDNFTLEDTCTEFEINAEKEGLYGIGMTYKATDKKISDFIVGLKLDGDYPYQKAAKFNFPRMWCDDKSTKTLLESDNQAAAQLTDYNQFYFNEAIDQNAESGEKFLIYLSKGHHKVSLVCTQGKMLLQSFRFTAVGIDSEYTKPDGESQLYQGSPIVMEGEDAVARSSYFLVDKSDSSSIDITPYSAEKSLINYIGGGNWKTVGDSIIWETPELESGYYCLGFSFRQNSVIGSKSYRALTIDGKAPFSEAETVGFAYSVNWQYTTLADKKNSPYRIYLSAGKHKIALRVTAGETAFLQTILTQAVNQIGSLYRDIVLITGETVDIYRDYDLFKKIGDMDQRLNNIRLMLDNARKTMLEISGEKSGTNYSMISNMIRIIDQMLENKSIAHRYKETFYSNYCSVSSILQDLDSMPLDIDKIILFSPKDKSGIKKVGVFGRIAFSAKRFVYSFVREYKSVSDADEDEDSENNLTLWINLGRDQAQVLSALINNSFTPKTGINVNLKLVNASLVQALLSGKGPDCLLQSSGGSPVNLAMRGVLYDLTQFDDYKEVLGRFQTGADISNWYKGGLYALPDTQSFFVMFYRTDILKKYGLSVPTTWEEFDLVAKLLMRNNMTVSLPAAASAGDWGFFPTLLLQNGVSLYATDGRKTTLDTPEAMSVFEKYVSYYSEQKFPLTMDFYNRFRTGTTPLGICDYSMYTTLKVAAPEIDGLWSFSSVPATVSQDGSVSHAVVGGTTGCSILEISKNPRNAWKFLKWWTEADTQLTYSNNLESILGPTGRLCLANIEAVKSLDWDGDVLDKLLDAWSEVKAIPEYPGSYYVTRAIYQAFWNVTDGNKNAKDMLLQYANEADDEIKRKWAQYTNRKQ